MRGLINSIHYFETRGLCTDTLVAPSFKQTYPRLLGPGPKVLTPGAGGILGRVFMSEPISAISAEPISVRAPTGATFERISPRASDRSRTPSPRTVPSVPRAIVGLTFDEQAAFEKLRNKVVIDLGPVFLYERVTYAGERRN